LWIEERQWKDAEERGRNFPLAPARARGLSALDTRDDARKTKGKKKPDQIEIGSGAFARLRPGNIGGRNTMNCTFRISCNQIACQALKQAGLPKRSGACASPNFDSRMRL
jgi:hypothetical protein